MHIRIEAPTKHGGHFRVSAIEKGTVVAEATAKDAAEANRLMAEAHANGVETLRGGGPMEEPTLPDKPAEMPPGFEGGPLRRGDGDKAPRFLGLPATTRKPAAVKPAVKPAKKPAKRGKAKKGGKG